MSGLENVVRLTEFQQRRAPVEPRAVRDPEAILRDLEALDGNLDLVAVEHLTAELAEALRDAGPLAVAIRREEYQKSLSGKVNAPAHIFDSALRGTWAGGVESQELAPGSSLAFAPPEPWADPVDGAELLEDLGTTFRRFVVLSEGALAVLALWVVHCFTFDVAWITPRLAITSPEKRCGKTLVLTLLGKLVPRPLLSANVTPAVLFRCVEKFRPTLLIDEADTFLHGKDELRGILNSGHQRDGCVLRTVGDDHEPRAFATFTPVAVAMIGELPDTLADRSLAIRMERRKPDETVERLRLDRLGPLEELRRRALRWATDQRDALALADPEVPTELHDRAADNWRPLLAIADRAGGHWPRSARQAALAASAGLGEDLSAGVRLLEDLRTLFETGGVDKLLSRQIVADLAAMEDRPWPEWKAGKPLTQRQLARLLQPFGVRPQQVRIGSETAKGYRLEYFDDAFARYIPQSVLESTTYAESAAATPGGGVSDLEGPPEPLQERMDSDVSDREGGSMGDTKDDTVREVIEL